MSFVLANMEITDNCDELKVHLGHQVYCNGLRNEWNVRK